MIPLWQRQKTFLLVSARGEIFPDSVVSGNGASVLPPVAELGCEVAL